MRRSGLLTNAILALGLLVSAASANAEKLDLSEGTMTVGGNLQFRINPTQINSLTGASMVWDINLQGGYFIMDNFELQAVLTSGGTFTNPVTLASVGFGLGARYYFDVGSCLFPYIGVAPGFVWRQAGSQWSVRLPVSAGMLIGLNSHVALDVGATAGFAWNLTTPGTTIFDMSAGYAGVKAFF